MANEVAGLDVLLYIDMSDVVGSPDWSLLGGQRNMTLGQTTEVIDARHKSSGAWPNSIASFLNWSVTGDMIRITGDPSQARLDALWRARTDAHIRVLYEDGGAHTGYAVIGDLSLAAPHNDVAVHSLNFAGNSELVAENIS